MTQPKKQLYDLNKPFALRWLTKLFFFRFYHGRMGESEIFWETNKIVSGVNTIYMMRMFAKKRG